MAPGNVLNSGSIFSSQDRSIALDFSIYSIVALMESSKETGCQTPEGPILCINNCGFFGSAATMNMCSKCHKDMVLKQHQAKLAASSIENIVNGSSMSNEIESTVVGAVDMQAGAVELKVVPAQTSGDLLPGQNSEVKEKEGPNRCTTCRKRVGLTGFSCRCGNLFCSVHRYSDKHNCPYDYRTAAQDAIAKENPVVKAGKLDKI
ncbi:Zinc finger A20 and AN1 domain-containing stress-associated protein 2 [Abeliophyllum distichum]|uniref:Zinc finger A20 and AN1 domain-containing stress-associated protein 2 n=1 Tax=Abeliophyllum distichum TaxID=126358 RepID=A0ABD1VF56_9LAMI